VSSKKTDQNEVNLIFSGTLQVVKNFFALLLLIGQKKESLFDSRQNNFTNCYDLMCSKAECAP